MLDDETDLFMRFMREDGVEMGYRTGSILDAAMRVHEHVLQGDVWFSTENGWIRNEENASRQLTEPLVVALVECWAEERLRTLRGMIGKNPGEPESVVQMREGCIRAEEFILAKTAVIIAVARDLVYVGSCECEDCSDTECDVCGDEE